MRLIDADALVKRMEDHLDYMMRRYPHDSRYWGGFEQALFCVDKAEVVDAVPVVHGRWVNAQEDEYDDCEWRCSVCGAWQFFMPSPKYSGYNYCPKCAAKMDEEEE